VATVAQALLLDIPEKLETRRLILAAARAGQGAMVNEAVMESREELKAWMPWAQRAPTLEESEAYCREAQAKWVARELLDFCILRGEDQRLVGRAGLHSIDWSIPKFEIGYWVRSSCMRQGIASEATLALVELARDKLGARRLEITSDARNAPSRRVAEKSGFTLEGIRCQSRRDSAGELADSCMYARTF
jgi:RimJ/RimL family protein N-acetyltransferase